MSPLTPNILWIVTTQWRRRTCGYAGDPDARTPALDRLASEATVYTTAVTPHPFGPFARAALLTGIPCPENGVSDYYDPLPPTARTLAPRLGGRGFMTAWFGKWHLARRDPTAALVGDAHARAIVPRESRGGFEFWEGFESGFLLNDPWLHGTRLPEPVQMRGYQSDVLGTRAGEWIEAQSADAPWFCAVSLESPHPPYDAPAPAPRPDPAALRLDPNVPRGGEVETRTRRELAGYHAHIAATDRSIGELVERVRARTMHGGRATRVAICSVHGDMHGAHGCFRKGWPHEESIGVPLMTLDLGGSAAARVERRPVSLIDMPGMAEAWALGRGWAPSGAPVAISMPSIVRLPHQCDRVWHGWRGDGWKVVFDRTSDEPWMIFDLESDPWEMDNLVGTARGAAILARAGLAGG